MLDLNLVETLVKCWETCKSTFSNSSDLLIHVDICEVNYMT
jgi:hypothetical protein